MHQYPSGSWQVASEDPLKDHSPTGEPPVLVLDARMQLKEVSIQDGSPQPCVR